MLSEKRHRKRLRTDTAGVPATDQRILESNLRGECSRLCVRGLSLAAGERSHKHHAGTDQDCAVEVKKREALGS